MIWKYQVNVDDSETAKRFKSEILKIDKNITVSVTKNKSQFLVKSSIETVNGGLDTKVVIDRQLKSLYDKYRNKIVENKFSIKEIIRKVVKESIINERVYDLKKVDRSNLATNAEVILDAFISEGFTGKYDPEAAQGFVIGPNGVKVEFTTGGENLYLNIEKINTKDAPKETIKSLKKFLTFIGNYQ